MSESGDVEGNTFAHASPLTELLATAGGGTPGSISRRRRLRLLFPCHAVTSGISGVALQLLDSVVSNPQLSGHFAPEYWMTAPQTEARRPYLRTALPRLPARIAFRLTCTSNWYRRLVTRRYLRDAKEGDFAWLFPSVEAHVYREAKERGCTVVKEIVNTALGAHGDSVRHAYESLGWPVGYVPPQADIDEECEQLPYADHLFSCSPEVSRTFIEAGASASRIIETSYGWSPEAFQPVQRRGEKLRFLFVASGCVRKGLPHLLQAWDRAKLDATLVVVGRLEDDVATRCASLLRSPSIEYHNYTSDLAPLYGGADVFVLPSFEEGSPLVGYLALAAGLPCLMTPASAGWVVREGVEGLIADPGDTNAWVELLRRAAGDADLRARLGANALERSREYTWDKVMARRCAALLQRLDGQ